MKDKKMDFPAVECKTNAAKKLFSKFGTSGIPRLVIISPSDGSTISTNGRNEVTHERLNPSFDCLAKWKNSVVVKEGPDEKIFPEAMRTWKDVDGREIQAVLKGLEGERVKLEKDGQVYIFPVSRLSAADQSYALNLQAPPPKPLPIAPDATE